MPRSTSEAAVWVPRARLPPRTTPTPPPTAGNRRATSTSSSSPITPAACRLAGQARWHKASGVSELGPLAKSRAAAKGRPERLTEHGAVVIGASPGYFVILFGSSPQTLEPVV